MWACNLRTAYAQPKHTQNDGSDDANRTGRHPDSRIANKAKRKMADGRRNQNHYTRIYRSVPHRKFRFYKRYSLSSCVRLNPGRWLDKTLLLLRHDTAGPRGKGNNSSGRLYRQSQRCPSGTGPRFFFLGLRRKGRYRRISVDS